MDIDKGKPVNTDRCHNIKNVILDPLLHRLYVTEYKKVLEICSCSCVH